MFQQSSLVGPFCISHSSILGSNVAQMTSLFRPLLSSILCCVIACGHAPAWLHVATCDGHSHAEDVCGEANVSSSTSETECSHCCHPRPTLGPVSSGQNDVQIDNDGESHGEHDSDNCFVCQSLASPCGVTSEFVSSIVTGLVSQPSALPGECIFASAALKIAHPRGPPVVA